MAKRLGLSIGQKQTQKLSPQQIQVMKLLMLPSMLLMEKIEEELDSNPALEKADNESDTEPTADSEIPADFDTPYESGSKDSDFSDDVMDNQTDSIDYGNLELDEMASRFTEDDPWEGKTSINNNSSDDEEKEAPMREEVTLQAYLLEQVELMEFRDETEKQIALQIVGNISDSGYLACKLTDIQVECEKNLNQDIEIEEIEEMLLKIQAFDPAGVGARSVQECLLLQIKQKVTLKTTSEESRYYLRLAARVLMEFFDEFKMKHYPKLQRGLGVTEEVLKNVDKEIRKLNPKPGALFASSRETSMNYIIPDFFVSNLDGILRLEVDSRNEPELKISDHFKEMLQAYKVTRGSGREEKSVTEAAIFVKEKIGAAKWFIDAIKQRQQTMFLTMQAIMLYQSEYFLSGDTQSIKPMILKNVAEATGLDISTVSRVANSKYVQTEFGTKRLKDFFSESLQTSDGDDVSTNAVKELLTNMIAKESPKKPLSDEKLKELLLEAGYEIARRTVAKYREQLGIQVARLRKKL